MKNDYKLHFHMFDGAEGGEGASTSTEGSEADVTPVIEYGKAETGAEGSQVGTDTTKGDGEVDLNAEFDALIKGKYKEPFGQKVQGAVNNRFKNAEDYQAKLQKWEDATALLAAKYGTKIGDVEALEKAIQSDDGFFAAQAEEDGMTPEQYRENLKLKMEAAKGRSMQEMFLQEQQKKQAFAQWETEAESLKDAFPSFDLNSELGNQDFVDALNRTGSVDMAFKIVHMQDILSGAMGQAQNTAKQEVIDTFKANAARPSENAMRSQPAIVRKSNPNDYTNDDIDEIFKRVDKGGSITF